MDEEHSHETDIWKRPQTEELVDLHVYLVPSDKWIEKRKLAKRDIIDHAISSGFVRVLPSTTLLELRCDISDQLGTEHISETFVFLRSVGRNFTQVKFRQEHELKVKSFLPPNAEEPEVYVKEGGYVLTRSASLGADVPLYFIASATRQETSSQSSGGVDVWPLAEEVKPENLANEDVDEPKRSLSLDRVNERRMTSTKIANNQQTVHSRKVSNSKNNRPPTPRVTEKAIVQAPKRRAPSVPKRTTTDSITENPKEPAEEEETVVNLSVEKPTERVLNSPPPRSAKHRENQNEPLQIPVPSPVPTQNGSGKKESLASEELGDITVEKDDNLKTNPKETLADIVNMDDAAIDLFWEKDQTRRKRNLQNGNPQNGERQQQFDKDKDFERHSEKSQFSFDSRDDVIMDPIRLLHDEGESLKSAQENCRDHFDEGFHSGELVVSEEENSVETLVGSTTNVKDEDLMKPSRAATPMPKATSFYVPVNIDSEIGKIQIVVEELRAERRLKELQRDTFMQKIRDLQKKKACTKDQMREEWRRRFMEVKKSTPRLEDHCNKLRQELEKLVKDMLVGVKHSEADSKPHRPSKKTSYKIMIMRHLQEVEDLRRRLQSVTVKLNAETKLRAQAEYEVKKLRQDLLHKKTQVTLTRKQASFPQTSEQFFISAV